jgi:hypothetical protein
MLRLASICCAVLLIACAKSQDQSRSSADSTAQVAPAPAPAVLSLADVAGTWDVRVTPENSDSAVVGYTLTARADTSGWTMKVANRPDLIPAHVTAVQGDSIVIRMGPYKSAVRAGVLVITDDVMRLQNGKLVGRKAAHYNTGGPDSVRAFRIEGSHSAH